MLAYSLAASAAKNYEKVAVIKSAASAASAKGGCAGSRPDHGLKFYVIWGGCASSRLISGFSDSNLLLQACAKDGLLPNRQALTFLLCPGGCSSYRLSYEDRHDMVCSCAVCDFLTIQLLAQPPRIT